MDARCHKGLLERLRDLFRPSEFDGMPHEDIERLAHDVGMSAAELKNVAAQGPQSSDLLYERLKAEGVFASDIERLERGLLRDLERDCSCCSAKDVCSKDLAEQPQSPGWMAYCANAATIDAVRRSKGRALI